MARSRHEAVWTAEEAVVKGRVRRNQAWVVVLLLAVGAAIIAMAWLRTMNFQTVTFELRSCQQPLTQESNWSQVQAAGCDPVPITGSTMVLWAGGDVQEASSGEGSAWTFEKVPLNTSLTAMELDLAAPAETVVLAEPDNENVRRRLTGDAPDLNWTANIGARGPTSYWILVTPRR